MVDLISNSKSYQDLLARLKSQIRTAQVRAAVAVNRELVLLTGDREGYSGASGQRGMGQ